MLLASFSIFTLCILASVQIGAAGNAFTIFTLLQSTDFKCLLAHGEVPVVRIYAGAKIDPNGLTNIDNARSAGFNGIEVYIQPDALSTTKSGSQQFQESFDYINDKYPMQRIWLLVTDPRTWSRNSIDNLKFIRDFIKAANRRKIAVGIYTNWYDWLLITNDYRELQNDCSVATGGCQLWYWHTLGQGGNGKTEKNFDDFRPFGSWKTPNIKEYDIVDSQFCRIPLNWSIFTTTSSKKQWKSANSRTNQTVLKNIGYVKAKEEAKIADTNDKFVIGNAF